MNLDFKVAGNIVKMMQAEVARGESAVTSVMARAGSGLKSDWRKQVTSSGLGNRLSRTIRSAAYPKGGKSLNAAALVWTNAPKIIGAFDRGVTIRSRDGFFLAIPTPAAGKFRGQRMTPALWERRNGLRLVFIYRRGRPSLLVAEARLSSKGIAKQSRSKTGRGVATVPIFILIPQTTLRKRLDFQRDAKKWEIRIPAMITNEWVDVDE